MAELCEIKLDPLIDTREALLSKKAVAEAAFANVASDYNAAWLPLQSSPALRELEAIKSMKLDDRLSQPPAMGTSTSSQAYLTSLYASITHLMPKFKAMLDKLAAATG